MNNISKTKFAIEFLLRDVNKKKDHRNLSALVYDIYVAYEESHRHYHTLEHIADCFDEYEEVEALFDNPLLSRFVLLLHDIVYIPGYRYCEAASAIRSLLFSNSLGLSSTESSIVSCGIHATNHSSVDNTIKEDKNFNDERLIKDIDLSILGKDFSRYMVYEQAIKAEFCIYNDEEYREGRTFFLNKTLEAPQIYLTDYFYEKYEKAARSNIRAAIDLLNPGK